MSPSGPRAKLASIVGYRALYFGLFLARTGEFHGPRLALIRPVVVPQVQAGSLGEIA